MAAANEVLTVNVTQKLGPIEGGRSIYIGTATGGSEYKTGGVPIVAAAEPRFVLPAFFDSVFLAALGAYAFVGGLNVKFLAGAATEGALAELAAAKTLAAIVPAGTPFVAIGPS